MMEAIKTRIIPVDDTEEVTFELMMVEDCWDTITLKIGDQSFQADWLGNMMPFFKRAIELWKEDR